MNPGLYCAIFLLLFVILTQRREREMAALRKMAKKKSVQERIEMVELAKKFIGKECIIYTFNSQISGTIMEVNDGGILVESKLAAEAVNLEYVVRISEHPRRKSRKNSTASD